MTFKLNHIYNEDCRVTLARLPDNSIDSIVTDPPYDLTTTNRWGKETKFSQSQSDVGKRFSKGFMGKEWDGTGIAFEVALWTECLRVLKPGVYLLAFGSTRTSHRMVCAIEDAGFEIRDSILWLYGSGFPKSLNISKAIDANTPEQIGSGKRKTLNAMGAGLNNRCNICGKPFFSGNPCQCDRSYKPATEASKLWNGWGTALKPAHEPICVARKPIAEKTVANNVLRYGTGGINVDECRIPHNGEKLRGGDNSTRKIAPASDGWDRPWRKDEQALLKRKSAADNQAEKSEQLGRFPSNVILDEFTGEILDQQAPDAGAFAPVKRGQKGKSNGVYGDFAQKGDDGDSFYDDKGGASRFYFIAKAHSSERNAGLHQFERSKQNVHATVKPVKLIQYLQKLVTPPGGIIYDPFGGSGTSAPAAQNNGFKWIMSEMIKEHYDIAIKRIYNNGGLFL